MMCSICGGLCLEPHDVDAEPWECCLQCGKLLAWCHCHGCDHCGILLTPEETPDDLCAKCLKKGG